MRADLLSPEEPSTPSISAVSQEHGVLPARLGAAIWRASELGRSDAQVAASGWASLDAQLPGGGWPLRSLTEVLAAQPSVLEWRLLAPSLRTVVASGGQVVVISPPRHPHLPGLLQEGLDDRKLVWIKAAPPAERLWVTEQLIKSNAAGAIVAWQPQARQKQIRRLQVCAQSWEGLIFLCRPISARHESSAAPLRVHAGVGLDWELKVDIIKRRGPVHEGNLVLPSILGGLSAVLTPRLRQPSRLISSREAASAVGRPVTASRLRPEAAVIR